MKQAPLASFRSALVQLTWYERFTYQPSNRLRKVFSTGALTCAHVTMYTCVYLCYRLSGLVQCTLIRCGSYTGWRAESGGSGRVWRPLSTAPRRKWSASCTGPLLWCPSLTEKCKEDSQKGKRCVHACTTFSAHLCGCLWQCVCMCHTQYIAVR